MLEKDSVFTDQVGGDHYKKLGEYQPWKVLPKWLTADELRGYVKGEAIVYLARERDKGGIDDIRKAKHVLELYLETLKAGLEQEPAQTRTSSNETGLISAHWPR